MHYWETYILPWGMDIALACLIFIVGRKVGQLVIRLLEGALRKARIEAMLVNFIGSISHALILLVVVVAALAQLGVDTTSLIALVGAAGLAVGLALQDSLKNFAAGVLLIIFRPFKEGDFVEAAGVSGLVEHISIFSSVLRTPDNREIIVPNGAIYSNVITNYSARETRRIDLVFGIGYESDLRLAKAELLALIEADERILKDPAPVVAVDSLADNSVNFVVRPWVKSADYWEVRWSLTEQVKLRFDEVGIAIPYPQMDVHLHREAE